GQSYILGCPDGGESLLGAAVASVDREMSGIRDAGKVKARERIAVLAALNLAYQLADRPARAAGPSRPAQEANSADGQPDLDALIHRIDAVLGDDGHLL
ncbi:MAG: cell division protein ZapA, partial [Rubrivivax sp.]